MGGFNSVDVFIYLVLIWLLILSFVLVWIKYKIRRDRHRYLLYSIRDKLVKYVIEDKIKRDSKEFNKLYKFINQVIKSVEDYDLITLLKIVREMEKISEKKKFPKFIENKYVEEILEELAKALAIITYENSLLVRLAVRIKNIKLPKNYTQLEVYQKAEKVHNELQHAM